MLLPLLSDVKRFIHSNLSQSIELSPSPYHSLQATAVICKQDASCIPEPKVLRKLPASNFNISIFKFIAVYE